MRALLRISRAIDAVTEQLGTLMAMVVSLLILVGVYNVVTRYVGAFFRRALASNLFVDLQWQLFSLLFFLGFAFILKHNENVRVDFLYAHWNTKRQALVNLLGHLLILVPFCLIGLIVTWQPVVFAWRIREISPNPGGLPIYPIKTVFLFGFGWLLIQTLGECIKHLAVLRDAIPPAAEAAIEAYHRKPIE